MKVNFRVEQPSGSLLCVEWQLFFAAYAMVPSSGGAAADMVAIWGSAGVWHLCACGLLMLACILGNGKSPSARQHSQLCPLHP